MKRKLQLAAILMIASLLCATAVSQSAGQSARLGALGVNGDVLDDPVNVTAYPSNILFWTNLVTADVGRGSYAYNGLWGAWKCKRLGALGLGLYGKQNNDNYNPARPVPTGNLVSLYWGSAFGEDAGIGAVLNYSGESERRERDVTPPDEYREENHGESAVVGARAGVHMPIGPFRRVETSMGYVARSWELKSERTERVVDRETSSGDFDFNLRAFSAGSGRVTLVPSFHFVFGSADGDASDLQGVDLSTGFKEDSDGDSRTYSGQLGVQIEAGKTTTIYGSIGGSHTSLDTKTDVLDIVHGGFDASSSHKADSERCVTDLPYVAVGIDAGVRDWLTLRFGAMKTQRSTVEEVTDRVGRDEPRRTSLSRQEQNVSRLDLACGFAIRVRDLRLDAVLNNDFLYDWGYISSGRPQSPVTQVSVTYTFD